MTCPPPSFPWSGSNRKSPQCQIHVSSHHLRISRGRGRRGMLPQSHSSTGNVSSFQSFFPISGCRGGGNNFLPFHHPRILFFLLFVSDVLLFLPPLPSANDPFCQFFSPAATVPPPVASLLTIASKKFTEGGRRRDGFVGAREWYECCCSGKRRGGGPTNGNLPNDGPSSPPPAVGGRQLFLLRSQSCF